MAPEHRQHVIAGHTLDPGELISDRHLTDRDHLQAVLLPIGRVHEQVLEIARPARLPQRVAQRVHVQALGLGVGHVEDVAGVRTVVVILPAEQRGRLVQQRGLYGWHPLRQAADLLISICLSQLEHLTGGKLMLYPSGTHREELTGLHATANVLRQRPARLYAAPDMGRRRSTYPMPKVV